MNQFNKGDSSDGDSYNFGSSGSKIKNCEKINNIQQTINNKAKFN